MELVTPGIGLIFWMSLSFGILLFLLGKFAWKPVMKSLKERENAIQDSLDAARKAKEESENLNLANEELLQRAKLERVEMLKEARRIEESIIAKAKDEATEEAKRIVDAAKQTIRNEKNAALAELKMQLASISIGIAEKILEEELKQDVKREEYMKKLIEKVNLN